MPGDFVSGVSQRRKIDRPGRVSGSEFRYEASKAEDFSDRDGMDPERGARGPGGRELQPEAVPEKKALLFQKPHPDEVPGRIKKEGEE